MALSYPNNLKSIFEIKYFKKFAWLPVILDDDKIIWLCIYYRLYVVRFGVLEYPHRNSSISKNDFILLKLSGKDRLV